VLLLIAFGIMLHCFWNHAALLYCLWHCCAACGIAVLPDACRSTSGKPVKDKARTDLRASRPQAHQLLTAVQPMPDLSESCHDKQAWQQHLQHKLASSPNSTRAEAFHSFNGGNET
jgi:hypothetical protein